MPHCGNSATEAAATYAGRMSGEPDDYDEFGMLGDNAAEAGLTLSTLPPVTRASFTLADGQEVSALAWGDAEPELVLLHWSAGRPCTSPSRPWPPRR